MDRGTMFASAQSASVLPKHGFELPLRDATSRVLEVRAISFDIVRIRLCAPGLDSRPVASFDQSHAAHRDGELRLVSGYTMLQYINGSDEVTISSHGRVVAGIRVESADLVVSLNADGDVVATSGAYETLFVGAEGGAGVGIAVAAGARAVGGTTVSISGEPLDIAVVHGPAPEKILNRFALLNSLHAAPESSTE